MKTKILFTIFLMVGAISVFSQPITITEADMPHVGTTVIYMEYNDQEIDPGASGANVTWDFSSLSSFSGGDMDTVSYVTPGSTPYTGYFSNATLSKETTILFADYLLGWLGYSYVKIEPSGYDFLGAFIYSYQQWNYNYFSPPLTLLKLPSTYQNTFATSSSFFSAPIKYPSSSCDSTKANGTYSVSSSIDGWGTIITPWGTFDCLRQLILYNITDNKYCLDSTGTWNYWVTSTPSFSIYSWWANGIEFPVLSISRISLYSGPNTKHIRCLINSTVGINDYFAKNSLKVVPNPSTNEVNFFITSSNPSKLVIYDRMGKLLTTLPVSQSKATINSAGLTKGLLFFKVLSEKGETLEQGKFIIE